MAELESRIDALAAAGLTVAWSYYFKLPKWLKDSLNECDVHVIAAHGTAPGDTFCVIRLSELGRLLGHTD